MSKNNTIMALQYQLGYQINTTGLIKQSIALSTQLDFLHPYATLADDILALNYNDFKLRKIINASNAPLYVCAVLLSERYNLETLIGTLDLEYNPIENYNMVEKSTDNRTLDYADKQSNSELSSGLRTSSLKKDNSQKIVDNVNTHAVAPFNTTSMTNTEQDTTKNTQQAYVDTDTTTQQPYVDKSEQKELAHTDTDNLIHELTRSGNVGVTTSQQMIESERALANINITAKIVDIVVKNICRGVQGTL